MPNAVTNLQASNGTFSNAVKVNWTASTGATSYTVWRNTTDDSSTATQSDSTAITGLTSYADTTAVSGTTYYYWVKATNSAGNSAFSSDASGTLGDSSDPSIVQASGTQPASMSAPQNLGAAAGQVVYGDLSSPNEVDWYSFTLGATGDGASNAVLNYIGDAGQMGLLLYSNATDSGPLRFGTSATNQESIALDGLAAGKYALRVYGYASHNYTLTVTAP